MLTPYPDADLENRFSQWASVRFEEVHARVLDLLPSPPARAIDVGAGSGRDALALAVRGYKVFAVEPWTAMRSVASERHGHASIRWIDDRLPDLLRVRETACSFDLLLVSAVWMHLEAQIRPRAMAALGAIADAGATLVITVRNPPDAARSMWHVPIGEVTDHARIHGFEMVREFKIVDALGRGSVTWDVYCGKKL